MAVQHPEPRLLAVVRMRGEIVHLPLTASPIKKGHISPKVKLALVKDRRINVPEIQRKSRVLSLSVLPVEMSSRQKLRNPPAKRVEREHVAHLRMPNPIQKGFVLLKARTAPTDGLMIKLLAILTKGLALDLSLFPVVTGSRHWSRTMPPGQRIYLNRN